MNTNGTRTTIQVRVRYGECDPMGIVHHSRYAVWFEMARTEMLRRQGLTYADMEKEGTFIVVSKLNMSYKQPARYDELIRITAILTRSGGAKIQHEYEVHRSSDLLCTGSTVLACLDRDGRIMRVPKALEKESWKPAPETTNEIIS
ncbi:MAG: acyl-CoA thioesterase [Deltaproteobacteria bacterium]|nr:acyl-CoA thioesterase [Deltaproteobacteria bacterium]